MTSNQTSESEETYASGLEDVVVARTRLSHVDGTRGALRIAGEPVDALAARRDFEWVARRLLRLATSGDAEADDDELRDDPPVLELFRPKLARERAEAYEQMLPEISLRRFDDSMEALRAAVAALPSRGDDLGDAMAVLGAIPVVNAAWVRRSRGKAPIPPSDECSHAEDAIRMLDGEDVAPPVSDALDAYWSTVSDHGLNASTFTARVVASTDSDLVSSTVAAIGALKGPLHGGAPGPVSEMLDAIGEADRAEEWLRAELDAGRRIMGMGHRVYEVRDPRAAVFEAEVERLEAADETTDRLELARTVEREAEQLLAQRQPDRDLRANVEFYTAVLLETIGIPRSLFSATFAAGRAAGWAAHALEQKRTGRLIRPRGAYVGP